MRKDDGTAAMVRLLNTSDTFRFELPLFEKPEYYADFKREELQLGLASLEKGFDSLQLRIWYGYPMSGDRVLTLVLSKKKWEAKVYDIVTYEDGYSQEPAADDVSVRYSYKGIMKEHQPRSGWQSFIRKLFDLDILTLPDIRKIKNFEETFPGTDGGGMMVEVAAVNIYRSYVYFSPEYYATKYSEAKKIVSIINLLEDELSLENMEEMNHKKNTAAQLRHLLKDIFEPKAAVKYDSVVLKELTIDDRKPLPKRKK